MINFIRETIANNVIYVDVKNENKVDIKLLDELLNIASNENILFNFESIKKLSKCSNSEIKEIIKCIKPRHGEILYDKFLTNEDYGFNEFHLAVFSYLCTYGFGFIPDFMIKEYDVNDLKPTNRPFIREIKVKDFSELKNDIIEIIGQETNLTNFNKILLSLTKDFVTINELKQIKIKNKEIFELLINRFSESELKEIFENIQNVKMFKILLKSFKKLNSTSNKKFIMRVFNQMNLDYIKNDLRTDRKFWIFIEKMIVTQQYKFKKFVKAQEIFKLLIDNNLNSYGQKLYKYKNGQKVDFTGDESRILRNYIELSEYGDFAQIFNSKIKLKTLFEILNAIESNMYNEKRYIRLKNKVKVIEKANYNVRHLKICYYEVCDAIRKKLKNINLF